jgi:hypothetical protein
MMDDPAYCRQATREPPLGEQQQQGAWLKQIEAALRASGIPARE